MCTKHSFVPILTLFVFLICGCVTDPAIKEVLNESVKNTGDNPKTTPLVVVTPKVTEKAADPTNIEQTPPVSETQHLEEIKLTTLELQKFAYELGLDPKKELSQEQKQQILDRKKLRQYERSLDSQKERLQYSKILPWLTSDREKIEVLSIPSIEGRQVWINNNNIWSRAKNLENFDALIESQDIAIGMPTDYVRKSWGEPKHIEISGNPIYKNERWQYLKQVSTPQGYRQQKRYVYFEGGRVSGWETEH